MSVARRVAQALKTDRLILVRNGETQYDVTIYLGSDFGERIQ
jgi:hypothetical protein